jgi:bifunctional oligoribonuclease and PAP phosphatase NrnA
VTVDLQREAAAVPAGVIDRIRRARSVLAIAHENPDADTIGASLAIARIVVSRGGRVTLACSDSPAPMYDFLPWIDRFRTDPEPDRGYDLVVLSDTAAIDRIGAIGERNATLIGELPRVIVDHHVSNDASGPADWIDPAAAATCELTTLLAVALGVPLDLDDGALATGLMAGIVMDTATFAHPNATPRTLRVAASLLEAGAPLAEISRRLYRSKPEAQLRLFGRVLGRLETDASGLVIWSTLRDADLAETGAIPAHSEGIIDLLAQSETAEVAILFKEADGGRTRLSVRTKPGGVDATVLTGAFGGGGHARAAGATVERSLDDAVPVVLAVADRLAADVRR